MALLKKIVTKHEGVSLTIDTHLSPIVLDADVAGFEKIVVSYFTVISALDQSDFRMYHTCGANSRDIYMGQEGKSEYPIEAKLSISSAHGPNEFVTKDDLLKAVEGYKELILRALS